MLRESRTWLRLLGLAPLAMVPVMRPSFSLQKSWPLLLLSFAFAGCSSGVASGAEADARKAAQERYAKAKALFEERCKTAGIVVQRTVKDVEGIELLKVRPKLEWADKRYFDPMFEGAAMAGEAQGDGYIWSFLRSEYRSKNYVETQRGGLVRPERPVLSGDLPMRRGYRFVEVADPAGHQRFRYSVPWNPNAGEYEGLAREVAIRARPRYAVDYEDLVDPTDRAYWIAGTRIKIVDQQTGEVIAQLTRYVWDRGFGVSTTGRWPWQHASAQGGNECPRDPAISYVTRFFIDTVLVPVQGD